MLGESLGLSPRAGAHAQQLVQLEPLLHAQQLLAEVEDHLGGRGRAALTAAETYSGMSGCSSITSISRATWYTECSECAKLRVRAAARADRVITHGSTMTGVCA